jgi:hypothetical protein
VSRPGPQQVGAFVRHQAEELTRLWRLARADERPAVFPGLLDGTVPSFLAEAGALLERGGEPGEAILRAAGALRWPPAIAPAELSAEWAVLRDVLLTSCESVDCEPAASAWLARAIEAADAATAAVDGGRGPTPPAITVVLVLASAPPPLRDP